MSSVRDLNNASGRDSKIVRDFASSDICVSLGLSQTSYYVLTSFGKGMSLMFQLLARALTRENDNFEPLIRYAISNLATLSTLPLPLVALFTIVHDICMWKRCQNFVAGEGAGSYACEKDVQKLSGRGPTTKCPLFHKLKSGHPSEA